MRYLLVLLSLCLATLTNAATITVGSGADCDATTLDEALALASAGDLIAINGETFPNTNAQVQIDLTLQGGGQACAATGTTQSRASLIGAPAASESVLRVRFAAIVRMTGLELSGGSGANGGGLWVDIASRVDANDLSVHDNLVTTAGGGILVGTAATLSVATGLGVSDAGVEVFGNQAADGGGIYIGANGALQIDAPGSRIATNVANRGGGIQVSPSGSFDLGQVLIEDHSVAGNGGGIYVESNAGSPNVLRLVSNRDTTITDNQAVNGAGIYFESGSQCNARLGSQISQNQASNTGGGIAVESGNCELELLGARILGNSATATGGGISLAESNSLDLLGASISGNTARAGAGVAVSNATLRLNSALIDTTATASIVSNNQATDEGGGLRLQGTGSSLYIGDANNGCMPSCRVSANSAGTNGAGIWAEDTYAELHVGTEIALNMASGNGGGYWAQRGTLLNIAGSTAQIATQVIANTAGGDGGGLYLRDLSATLAWIEIGAAGMGNNAGNDGGGLYLVADLVPNAQVRLVNSRINENGAIGDGGGIFSSGRSVFLQADLANDDITDAAPDCVPATLPANRYCAEMIGNSAGATGGAARIVGDASLSIQGAAIRSNQADEGAGIWTFGADDIVIRQSLIADNSSEGLRMQVGGDLTISDSSFVNNLNTAIDLEGGVVAQIDRTLVWANTGGVSTTINVALSGTCNNSQDNSLAGLSMAPILTTNARGDYHYGTGSAGVDSCGSGPAFDLDSVARPLGANWDIGAFEGEYSTVIDAIFATDFESN